MSSQVIDLGVNRKRIYDFLLVINIDASPTVFETLTFKARKWIAFPPLPCLTPAGGKPLEFLDETYRAKTRWMGLPYGENCIILTSTAFD